MKRLISEQAGVIDEINLNSHGHMSFRIGPHRYIYKTVTPGGYKKFKGMSKNVGPAMAYIHSIVPSRQRFKVVNGKEIPLDKELRQELQGQQDLFPGDKQ